MIKNFFISMVLLLSSLQMMAQTPDWVTRHPVSDKMYYGVGVASMKEANYVQVATDNALADISSQIYTKLENNSFFQTIDVDGHSRELFTDSIQKNLTAWLEGQKLEGSYQQNDSYYVYFSLDKEVYQKNAEIRRQRAIRTGKDYLTKAKAAEQKMDLSQALVLYSKGLESIQPWLFMDLSSDGVNIPVELYHSYINIFSGLALTVNHTQVEGEPFKAIPTAIAACLSRDGVVVPNVKLKAAFVSGSGDVTEPVATDFNGTSTFYVTNITSKKRIQELSITLDDSFITTLPEAYRELIKDKGWPSVKVVVVLKNQPMSAFFLMSDDNEVEGCERPLRSFLGSKYFNFTEDPDGAQCFIEVSTGMAMGDVVTGGIYDLNSCLCSIQIKIYNNQTQELLLDFSINDHKVLVPVTKSESQFMAMCVRELMKAVKRDLPRKMKTIEIF